MKIKQILTTLTLAIIINVVAAPTDVRAHDIDIYVTPTPINAEPLLMFAIDLRPSLGASKCSGYDASDDTSPCYQLAPYMKQLDGTPIDPTGGVSALEAYRSALIMTIQEQVIDKGHKVKVGLMINHAGTNNCAGPSSSECSGGGYVFFALRSINDAAVQPDADWLAFKTALRTLDLSRNPKFQGSEMMFEFYRYLKGGDVYSGKLGHDDYDAFDPGGAGTPYNIDDGRDTGGAVPSDPTPWKWDINALTSKFSDTYLSPITDKCQKIYSFNFIFGTLNQDADAHNITESEMQITSLPTQNDKRYEAILARLFAIDFSNGASDVIQKVTSFIYTEGPVAKQHNWALAGSGGRKTAVDISDPESLVEDFSSELDNILSTSTTFVAPSVAVNVYNRSQVERDIFIAMFQAEGTARWNGNVKKLLLGEDASGLTILEDASSPPVNAIASDGRINKTALTYWAIAADIPAPASITETQYSPGKDGRAVNRGGNGSKIPGFKLKCVDANDISCNDLVSGPQVPSDYTVGATNETGAVTNTSKRLMYTVNAGGTAFMPFEATATAAQDLETDLGATSWGIDGDANDICDADTDTTSACALIKYARGLYDFADGTQTDGSANLPWNMADALHSRPLTINYGTGDPSKGFTIANPDVRVFVGTNEGVMRMIRNRKSDGTQDGSEGWAFMPRETLGILKSLKTNTGDHPYGVDGESTALIFDYNRDGNIVVIDANADGIPDPGTDTDADGIPDTGVSDRAVIFFGLRRGGKAYYAIDISDPDKPFLLWRIKKTAGGKFDELGQSWSTPRIRRMVVNSTTGTDVRVPEILAFFGGGYDLNKDNHGHAYAPGTTLDDTEGNAIFVVNAYTGKLVWKAVKDAAATTPTYDIATKTYKRADLFDSIPSSMTVVDTDGNDLSDRFYVGDTGGVVWRGDMKSSNQANWSLNPIMSVGRHYNTAAEHDRRFFYAPDYVQAKDPTSANAFDAIVIGSGDRTEPLAIDTADYMFMLKATGTDLLTHNVITYAPTTKTFADLATVDCIQTGTCGGTPPDLSNGWKFILDCPLTDNGGSATRCGEKNLSSSFTIGGEIFMTSYIPAGGLGSCAPSEGSGLIYRIDLNDGSATGDQNNDGAVDITDLAQQLSSGGIPAEVVSLGGDDILQPDLTVTKSSVSGGFRTYWTDMHD